MVTTGDEGDDVTTWPPWREISKVGRVNFSLLGDVFKVLKQNFLVLLFIVDLCKGIYLD